MITEIAADVANEIQADTAFDAFLIHDDDLQMVGGGSLVNFY